MKRIYSIIALIAAVAMFTACGSDDASYKATPTLDIASADVLFEAEGGDGYITANTTSELTATTESNWVTLTVTGNVVTVTADPNITLDGRSAVIKLSAGGTETTITATQKASIYGVPSLEYEIGDYEASLEIPVVHTLPVTVESNAEWITAVFNEETNEIEIVAENNDEADPREGTITISMGDYSDEITITQKGFLLEVAEDRFNITDGSEKTANIDVEHSRTVEVSCEEDWITATFDETNNQLVIKAAANSGEPRYGYVVVTSGPVTKKVLVVQYDLSKDIYGIYYLYYQTSSGWRYFVSMIDEDSSSLIFMIPAGTNNAQSILQIPLNIDTKEGTLEAGPCSTMMGTLTYKNVDFYMFLIFGCTDGYWTGYVNTTAMSEGAFEMTVYEDEETGETSLSKSIEWGGTFGTRTIDYWRLQMLKTNEFAAANSFGAWTTMYYPQMEMEIEAEDEETAKTFNLLAPLGSRENPLPATGMPFE